MAAVLQMEFDRSRLNRIWRENVGIRRQSAETLAHEIISGAVSDCFHNGGTVVLVVTEKTVTVVQRAVEPEDLDVVTP